MPLQGQQRFHALQSLRHDRVKVNGPLLELNPALCNPGYVQKVVNQPCQVRDLTLYYFDGRAPPGGVKSR